MFQCPATEKNIDLTLINLRRKQFVAEKSLTVNGEIFVLVNFRENCHVTILVYFYFLCFLCQPLKVSVNANELYQKRISAKISFSHLVEVNLELKPGTFPILVGLFSMELMDHLSGLDH